MAVCLWVTSMSMQAASAISTSAESLSPHAHERSPLWISLSEEQKMIVEMVRQFVREEIVPLEEHLDPDADELLPEDYNRLVAQTKAMGLYGLDTPPEFGGPDIDLVTRCLIAIECSQHRAGLYAPCYNVFGGARQAQLFEATEAQKARYLYPMLRGEKKVFWVIGAVRRQRPGARHPDAGGSGR